MTKFLNYIYCAISDNKIGLFLLHGTPEHYTPKLRDVRIFYFASKRIKYTKFHSIKLKLILSLFLPVFFLFFEKFPINCKSTKSKILRAFKIKISPSTEHLMTNETSHLMMFQNDRTSVTDATNAQNAKEKKFGLVAKFILVIAASRQPYQTEG